MSEAPETAGYFHLRMDDFVAPSRRMDAFPSMQYDIPRTYLPDTVTFKYPMDADVTFIVGDRPVYVDAGSLLFIAPYLTYSEHYMQPGGTILNIVMRPSRIRDALPRVFETANPIRYFLEQCGQKNGPSFLHLQSVDSPFDGEFFRQFAAFCIGSADHDPLELLMWESRFELILLRILSRQEHYTFHSGSSLAQSDVLSQVIGYVQRNLSTATLEGAAGHLGWNMPYLSRHIKNQTGRTFSAIVQVLKLDEAANLLRSTRLSVEDVMARVGYTGKAHFYEIFLLRFGVTPAQYRKGSKGTLESSHLPISK